MTVVVEGGDSDSCGSGSGSVCGCGSEGGDDFGDGGGGGCCGSSGRSRGYGGDDCVAVMVPTMVCKVSSYSGR